jgi:hypothetical protein
MRLHYQGTPSDYKLQRFGKITAFNEQVWNNLAFIKFHHSRSDLLFEVTSNIFCQDFAKIDRFTQSIVIPHPLKMI